MCGRFVALSREEVADVVAAVERGENPAALASRPDRPLAYPGNAIDAFGIPRAQSGRLAGHTAALPLAIGRFNWGFPVDWAKRPVFNTRIESALSGKGMWRAMVEGGRCIVPVASFFEPHATETVPSPRTGRPVKRAYEFAALDGTPLLLAALTDEVNCSIVTTEPNGCVSSVHDRMPLVLRPDEARIWLAGEVGAWEKFADRSAFDLAAFPDPRQGAAQPASPQPAPPDQLSLF